MTNSYAVELTRALVRIDTVNPPGNEARAIGLVRAELEPLGFRCAEAPLGPGRSSLVARAGGTGRVLAFTGHVDTVPLGSRAWSVDPFGGAIIDGRLYGRGSSDMKSGVAAFVAAARDYGRRDEGESGLLLVITAGEETGCDGARSVAETAGLLGTADALLIGEPTANVPLVGHKGALWLEAAAEGVTAHGSMPQNGVNAVVKAAELVMRLQDFDFNHMRHPVLGAPTLSIGTFHGGININSVPDRAVVSLDIRTLPGQSHDELRAQMSAFLGAETRVSTLLDLPAIWTAPEHPWVRRVCALAHHIAGVGGEPQGVCYFTDGSVLAAALGAPPAMILGPGEPDLAHQTDEYCRVDRIYEATALYAAILRDWYGEALRGPAPVAGQLADGRIAP